MFFFCGGKTNWIHCVVELDVRWILRRKLDSFRGRRKQLSKPFFCGFFFTFRTGHTHTHTHTHDAIRREGVGGVTSAGGMLWSRSSSGFRIPVSACCGRHQASLSATHSISEGRRGPPASPIRSSFLPSFLASFLSCLPFFLTPSCFGSFCLFRSSESTSAVVVVVFFSSFYRSSSSDWSLHVEVVVVVVVVVVVPGFSNGFVSDRFTLVDERRWGVGGGGGGLREGEGKTPSAR